MPRKKSTQPSIPSAIPTDSEKLLNEQRNRKWWLYADEYGDLIINHLSAAESFRISDKTAARAKFVKAFVREMETFDSVVRGSDTPTRGYIAYATEFAVRKLFSTDRFIKSFVEFCEPASDSHDVIEAIKNRVELRHASREQIYDWVNQVIDHASDWCVTKKESISQFFVDAKASPDTAIKDAEYWQSIYAQQSAIREAERQRKREERRQKELIEDELDDSVPVRADGDDSAEKFGCFIAIPFAIVGLAIHPAAGLILGVIAFAIASKVAKEVGVGCAIAALVIVGLMILGNLSK